MIAKATGVGAESKAQFNPLLPQYVQDPRPFVRRLREAEPVHWSEAVGVWVVTGYAEVMAALQDEGLSAAVAHWDRYQQFFVRGGEADELADTYSKWMLQLDPPAHTRLRALVNKAFTPRAVAAMAPLIGRVAEELLDRVGAAGRMDVVGDLAYPLPIVVIAEMLGVPREDHGRIKEWSAALLPSFTPGMSLRVAREVAGALREFGAYFRRLAALKRANPGGDLLSALIAARDNADSLSDDELVATAILLAFAGHASTVQVLAGAILLVIENSPARALLGEGPRLATPAVEEILRYVCPAQFMYRAAKQDTVLGGKRIPKGQMVFLSIVGANFDPVQFRDPDRFDPARSPNRHLAFGYGIHYCAGAPLARLEAQVVIPIVLRRLKNLELAGPVRREPSMLFRGISSMPVTFSPVAGGAGGHG